jgi:hypothetical protein
MKNRLAILLLVITGLTSSCSKKEEGRDYFPINKEEEFSLSFSAPSGATLQGKMVVRNQGEEVINGKTYTKYFAEISAPTTDSQQSPIIVYSRITPEGVYSVVDEHKDFPEFLDYPFPLKVGTTWTRVKFEGEQKCRVESIEDVQLPDKTYEKCLKISFQQESGENPINGIEYLAKGIGNVKVVFNYKSGLNATLLLLRYS